MQSNKSRREQTIHKLKISEMYLVAKPYIGQKKLN